MKEEPRIVRVDVGHIAFNESPIVRATLRDDVIEEYAEAYKSHELPPIVLFEIAKNRFIIADGHHRFWAQFRILKRDTIQALLRPGGQEEALAFALQSNEEHGLRRSIADRRVCIIRALRQWPKSSDSNIAALCRVSHHTVKAVREELEAGGDIKKTETRTDKRGVERPASKPKKTEAQKSDLGNCQDATTSKSTNESNKPKKIEVLDRVGKPLTAHALKFWERGVEVSAMLHSISTLNGALRKAQKEEDLMFAEVNISSALADLGKVWSNLSTAVPYALCTECLGQPSTKPEGCRLCKGRGLISKFRWDALVPAEVKRIATAKKS